MHAGRERLDAQCGVVGQEDGVCLPRPRATDGSARHNLVGEKSSKIKTSRVGECSSIRLRHGHHTHKFIDIPGRHFGWRGEEAAGTQRRAGRGRIGDEAC